MQEVTTEMRERETDDLTERGGERKIIYLKHRKI
jgi:hypothetical protein